MLRTRVALRAALLEMLEEDAFDQIAVTEIAIKAKVGYATFFRHYASKEELLNDLASDEIAELLAMAIPVVFEAGSRESCRALCDFVYQHRKLWRALLTGGAAAVVRAEFVGQARKIVKGMPQKRGAIPHDLTVVCAAGSTIDALAWWLSQARPYSIDRMAEIIDQLIISPVVTAQ